MSKKRKVTRNEAQNELKTLEAKWLRDRRLANVDPVQAKVFAAKVAALLDHAEQRKLDVDPTMWPLHRIADLVKMDEDTFRQALADLQQVGVLNGSFRFCKVIAAPRGREKAAPSSEGGLLRYRCAKSGGVNIADRDEYIMEDQEVAYTEGDIAESPNLQTAIANEWLVRMDVPKDQQKEGP